MPQNERAGGYFMSHANLFRPCLFGARGSAGGRCGHGLSSSLSVSANRTPRMLSTLTESVMPACFRLSVRDFFRASTLRLSAAVSESWRLQELPDRPPPASRMSSVTWASLSLSEEEI